jgi:formate-dependent nitrite reductase membrane component NrfD
MVMEALNGAPIDTIECVLLAGSLVLLLLAVAAHVRRDRDRPGKVESLARLFSRYRVLFLGGVVGAGTLLPAALALVGALAPASRAAVGIACFVLTLAGGFLLRLVTLRVGYFPPVSGRLRLSKRR